MVQVPGDSQTNSVLFLRGDMSKTHCKQKRNDSTNQIMFLRGDMGKTCCK
jgi:hypothetical protein